MKADELDFTTAIQVAIQTEDAAKVAQKTAYGPKSVPALAIAQKPSRQQPSASAPSQEGIVSWTAMMLPLWQFRPYRNFLQVQRCQVQFLQINLEAVCRKKARSKAQGFKWIDVLEMVKAAPCRNSEVQKLQVSIHINGKAFTLELDTAAGVWTELGKPKRQQAQWRYIRQVSIHCRSLELLPPRPSTVMSASHTQFRFLCPTFPI